MNVRMCFGEWLNATKGLNVMIDEDGHIVPRRVDLERKYFSEYLHECREYENQKEERISYTLEALKSEGIQCKLMSLQNGHINATTKHGVTIAYYATTGTIAGYKKRKGLDDLIKLCKGE